jgi:hypothetical protein
MVEQWFCKPQVIGSNPVSSSIGGIAQLGEHLLCKQDVIGSSPITSTMAKWWNWYTQQT